VQLNGKIPIHARLPLYGGRIIKKRSGRSGELKPPLDPIKPPCSIKIKVLRPNTRTRAELVKVYNGGQAITLYRLRKQTIII